MDSHVFDGMITALVVIGAIVGAVVMLIALEVVPYLWRHISWVR